MIEDSSVLEDREIERLRQQIDRIDHEILRLLGERASLAVEVGERKRQKGLPVYDPIREKALLDRLAQSGQLPLDNQSIDCVFQAIIEICRRLEQQHVAQG